MSQGPAIQSPGYVMATDCGLTLMLLVALLSALAVATCGCAGYIHDSSANATQASIDTIHLPDNRQKLADVGGDMASAARTKLLDPKANADDINALSAAVLPPLRLQLTGARDDLLGPDTRRLTVQLLDVVNPYLATWRETLGGQPLRDDVHQLVEQEGPHLGAVAGAAAAQAVTQGLAAARVQVNAEAQSARTWAIDMGAILFVAIGAIVFAFYEIRAHRKLLAAITSKL